MNHLNRFACAFVAVVAGGAFGLGCGGESEDNQNGTPDAGGAVTGSYNHFASSTLKVGANPNEASGLAFVDFDGNGSKDNALGVSLATVSSLINVDMALSTAVTEGSVVILHSVRTDDVSSDPSVSWQIWLGEPQANPKFDGTGAFTVAANAPRTAILSGKIEGGKYTGEAAEVAIELSLVAGATPLRVRLIAAHLEASVTSSSISNGRIAGAITRQELNDNVLPAIATLLDARIGADAGCRTDLEMCEASNKLIRQNFDKSPNDGTISAAEVRDSVLIQALLDADLDLLKADGTRGTDGNKESLSVTLGFSGVKATFTAPTE